MRGDSVLPSSSAGAYGSLSPAGTTTPLTGYQQHENRGESRRAMDRVVAALFSVTVVVALAFAITGAPLRGNGAGPLRMGAFDSSSSTVDEQTDADDTYDHWYIYKVTYPAPSGQTDGLFDFMQTHLGAYSCEKVGLGCDGFKLNCQFGQYVDRQVHFMVAPDLPSEADDGDGVGVDGWADIMMKSYGDMSTFDSPFLHEASQIFVDDIRSKITALEADNHVIMKRTSLSEAGDVLGHALVPVGGKIFHFVGRIDDVTDESEAESDGFSSWKDHECPDAHSVSGDADDFHSKMSDIGSHLLFGATTAVSDLQSDDFQLILKHLETTLGAKLSETKTDHCAVITLEFENGDSAMTGGQYDQNVAIRFVQNFAHPVSKTGHSVKDYEEYIQKTHERFLTQPENHDIEARWRNWDHWLDFHFGIKYDNSDTCLDTAKEINNMLLMDHIPVGKRMVTFDGDHYYSGYPGLAMTIEYNAECHFGEGTSDICACSAMNSNFLAQDKDIMDGVCSEIVTLDTLSRENGGVMPPPPDSVDPGALEAAAGVDEGTSGDTAALSLSH